MKKTAFLQIKITPCAAEVELNARGLFGFHDSPSCPDCKKTEDGYLVHSGDSIFSPFVGHYPDVNTVISPHPVYYV